MTRFLAVLATTLLLAHSAWALATVPVQIKTAKDVQPMNLELAITPATREHGLMDRKVLAPSEGMLFIFPKAARCAFWMKNTLIPLDIIFIDPQGTVVRVAANAKPMSLDEIDSTKPILSVIELAGGEAAARGITAGAKVTYQLPAITHVE